MARSLIIARIAPEADDDVARIFERSDRTELPGIVGVTHRSLWRLGDVYVHLVDTQSDGGEAIERARAHPEFARVSEELSSHISPYLSTWRSPADAQARCFYHYEPNGDEHR